MKVCKISGAYGIVKQNGAWWACGNVGGANWIAFDDYPTRDEAVKQARWLASREEADKAFVRKNGA